MKFCSWKLIFCLFILVVENLNGQDTVRAGRGRRDTTNLFTDSLIADLKKLNASYITNIRAEAINKVVVGLEGKSEQYHTLNTAIVSADSIASLKSGVHEDVKQLKTLKTSIANYSNSLSATKKEIQRITAHYAVDETNHPRAGRYLSDTDNLLTRKIDSLETIQGTIDNVLRKNEAFLIHLNNVKEADAKVAKPDSSKNKSSLWRANSTKISKDVLLSNIKNNYSSNSSADTYFNKIDWGSRILLFLFSIVYAYWIYRLHDVLRKGKGTKFDRALIGSIVGKTIIFYLTLLPFVSLYTPSFVLQAAQLIIMTIFMLMLLDRMTVQQKKIVGILFLFYILDIFVNMIVSEDMLLRIICIAFNLVALIVVSYTKKKIKAPESPGYITGFVFVIFVLLNVTAILLNLVGEVEASRSFSIACAVGLLQSFTLRYFAEMIHADVSKQFEKDHAIKGFWNRFNRQRTLKIVNEVLRLLCVLLAIIVLANNLQFIEQLLGVSEDIFGKIRKIGDISFTLGNLVVAILLLIFTNWLQRNINLIVLGGENGKIQSAEYNQKMTLFPLVRLAIILVGFFFAISALGMSLSKLTVVIGALSVGVGLGLQNIITNFVSGIILVFDKPFRVGDQIELGDKKGKVKEIGIRASILETADGADVIIPNGDLLSGRVVNWTLSHDFGRTSFTVQIDRKADLKTVTSWIKQAMAESPFIVQATDIAVSIQDISDDMIYLSVGCWINSSSNSGSFKSDVLQKLYKKFEESGLKFYSILPLRVS